MNGNLWFDETRHEEASFPQRLQFLGWDEFQRLSGIPYEKLESWENWLLAVWSYTADYKTYKLNRNNIPLFEIAHNAIFNSEIEPLEGLLGRSCAELDGVHSLKKRVDLVADWLEKNNEVLKKIGSVQPKRRKRLN